VTKLGSPVSSKVLVVLSYFWYQNNFRHLLQHAQNFTILLAWYEDHNAMSKTTTLRLEKFHFDT